MEHPSLDAYLGAMESDELASLNDLLGQLEGHPAWAAYQQLLDVCVDKATHQLLGRPQASVERYAHQAGAILGLKQAGSGIIDKVKAKTAAVLAALGEDV